jgi:hypothetical protein
MLASTTVLQCCAEIENTVVRVQDTHWLSMDAVLLNDETGAMFKLRCLFNYFREDNSELVPSGWYAVLALVCKKHLTTY